MVFAPRDHIQNLISRVTEANLHSVCDEIHRHIRPENGRRIIRTIVISIINEAAWSDGTLVPQHQLARVCWEIHNLCLTPVYGAGEFHSVLLTQMLNEHCRREFVDASRELENEPDDEENSSIVLDLAVFVGELYKLGLVQDEVMNQVYLENLDCGNNGSDVKAGAMCLLLELVIARWDVDPTPRDLDVRPYVRSLLDYVGRHDLPSDLVEEIEAIALKFGMQTHPTGPRATHHGKTHTPPRSAFATKNVSDERHPEYFLHEGDVDLVCCSNDRRIIFRVHGQRLVANSSILTGLLSQDKLESLPTSDGRPQIPWEDDPVEFTTLLKVLYEQTLPFEVDRPPFPEFASLLRLSTKYEINDIRDVLLTNLRTISLPAQDAREIIPIYRDYFKEPRPHPNEILKLFHDLRVEFALPFAFYEACVAGIKSLTNTDPSITLPPVPLSRAVRGFYALREWEWKITRCILFLDRQSHVSSKCRSLNLRTKDSGSPLQDVLRVICPRSRTTPGDILHILDVPYGDSCVDCVRRWNEIIQQAKADLWRSLPEIFCMEP